MLGNDTIVRILKQIVTVHSFSTFFWNFGKCFTNIFSRICQHFTVPRNLRVQEILFSFLRCVYSWRSRRPCDFPKRASWRLKMANWISNILGNFCMNTSLGTFVGTWVFFQIDFNWIELKKKSWNDSEIFQKIHVYKLDTLILEIFIKKLIKIQLKSLNILCLAFTKK